MSEPVWKSLCVLCAARDRVRRLDAGHVCPECVAWLTGTLSRIGELVSMATTERVTSTGSSSGKPVFGSKPPLSVDGLDPWLVLVRTTDAPPWPTLLDVVEAWERLIRCERELSPYGPASLARGGATVWGCLSFLASSVEWITTTTDFPVEDFADEMRACLRAVRKWDEDAAARGNVIPCPTQDDDGGECGYRLRFVETDERVTCRRCKVTRDVAQLVAVGLVGTAEVWVDPQAVALYYGIAESTLRKWAARGKVQRSHGRYLMSDVAAMMETA